MLMNIVVATTNIHKMREIVRILPHHSFLTPADLEVSFSFPEHGKTFMANALGKAYHCMKTISAAYPVIADDSGICVETLSGKPGIHSARFGRLHGIRKKDDIARNMLLLRKLGAATDRRAHYVCAAVFLDTTYRVCAIQERWDGAIAVHPSSASGGFGYDPLFIPQEKKVSVAELSDDEKDRYSHRGKALRALMQCADSLSISAYRDATLK